MFRVDDGVAFLQVVIEHDDAEHVDHLEDMQAYRTFSADIDDRCSETPETIACDRDLGLALKGQALNQGESPDDQPTILVPQRARSSEASPSQLARVSALHQRMSPAV